MREDKLPWGDRTDRVGMIIAGIVILAMVVILLANVVRYAVA